jgi:hypothetical protein
MLRWGCWNLVRNSTISAHVEATFELLSISILSLESFLIQQHLPFEVNQLPRQQTQPAWATQIGPVGDSPFKDSGAKLSAPSARSGAPHAWQVSLFAFRRHAEFCGYAGDTRLLYSLPSDLGALATQLKEA